MTIDVYKRQAIKGERFDGHSFIEQAWSLGADCVLSQTAFDVPEGKALILVEDTRAAMLLSLIHIWKTKRSKRH